jgi:hypothetical protein
MEARRAAADTGETGLRQWARAQIGQAVCGRCERTVVVGDPVQLVTFPGMARRLVRCETCAGSPAPPELPGRIEQSERVGQPMTRLGLTPWSVLPFDGKAAAIAREPGEDDDA